MSSVMAKLSAPHNVMCNDTVDIGVWRVLCASMIDVLWVAWTTWAHDQSAPKKAWREVCSLREEWKSNVRERIKTLWFRAQRLSVEKSIHVKYYVPGSKWSTKEVRENSPRGEFKIRWVGPLCEVVDDIITVNL